MMESIQFLNLITKEFVLSLLINWRYTKVVEWDNGYLVVMAKYKEVPEVEEYIDLIPILDMLYYDTETFLKPIKEVKIDAAQCKRCS